jgi:hypothetical protein
MRAIRTSPKLLEHIARETSVARLLARVVENALLARGMVLGPEQLTKIELQLTRHLDNSAERRDVDEMDTCFLVVPGCSAETKLHTVAPTLEDLMTALSDLEQQLAGLVLQAGVASATWTLLK